MKRMFEILRIILITPFALIWMICAIVIGMIHLEFLQVLLESVIRKINENG